MAKTKFFHKNRKKNRFSFADITKSRIFAPLFRTTEAYGRLAQLVQSICLTSRGSAVRIRQRPLPTDKPSGKMTKRVRSHTLGRLAQLVQSICLTSRGSAVRIRQRPHHTRGRRQHPLFLPLLFFGMPAHCPLCYTRMALRGIISENRRKICYTTQNLPIFHLSQASPIAKVLYLCTVFFMVLDF